MRHRANPKFWRFYEQLSADIQRLANENYERLKADPWHPSRHFKRVGKRWSARIGIHYRAVACRLVEGPPPEWDRWDRGPLY